MDKRQEELLAKLKSLVSVPDGENPLLNKRDAIRLATEHGIVYRYAKNGPMYEVRWSLDHPVELVAEVNLCEILVKKIIEHYDIEQVGVVERLDEMFEAEEDPYVPGMSEIVEEIDNITPAALKLAQEEAVDLTDVVGTGKDGKITIEDVRVWIETHPFGAGTTSS